jgi:hypothetical protein
VKYSGDQNTRTLEERLRAVAVSLNEKWNGRKETTMS